MKKDKTSIEVANISDVGKVRQKNEDYFGHFTGSFGELIIVSDGMGGNKGGFVASRVTVDVVKKHFESLPVEFNEKVELELCLVNADKELKRQAEEDAELKEMGATAVVVLIRNSMAYLAHIGDSRIYLIRNRSIHQLTKDHSLVQQLIDAKILTEEGAKTHPRRNVITRSLGADGNSEPETQEPIALFKDDKFILCSDGLTSYIDGDELKNIVESKPSQQACGQLINIANERGGRDNITVQIIRVVKGKKQPIKIPYDLKKYALPAAVSLLVLCVMITAFVFRSYFFSTTNAKTEVGAIAKDTILKAFTAETISKQDLQKIGSKVDSLVCVKNKLKEFKTSKKSNLKISEKTIKSSFVKLREKVFGDSSIVTLKILNDKSKNCYALAGGSIHITNTLLDDIGDEGAVLFLLAHQLEHIKLRHAEKLFIDSLKLKNVKSLIDTLSKVDVKVFQSPMTKEMELQADSLAFVLLKETGIDLKSVNTLLSKLKSLQSEDKSSEKLRDIHSSDLFIADREGQIQKLNKK